MARTRTIVLLALFALVAFAVAEGDALDRTQELPESMRPPPLDESGDYVDPRNLPPPEATESYRKMKQALEEMQQAQETCETPFGAELGHVHGVAAYSNCNDHHISGTDHVLTTTIPGKSGAATAVTGMKWQCVEFARRYLLQKFGVMFGDVMGAVDIWRFTSVAKHGDASSRLNLGRYRNHDDADRWPEAGSLIVWPIQEDMPFGHVGVIAEVVPMEDDEQQQEVKSSNDVRKPRRVARIRVGDQNYRSKKWRYDGYERELFLETFDGEYFGIADPDGYRTFGWMSYEPDIKPLDALLHIDDDPGMPKAAIPAAQPKFKGAVDAKDGEGGSEEPKEAAATPTPTKAATTKEADEDEGEF